MRRLLGRGDVVGHDVINGGYVTVIDDFVVSTDVLDEVVFQSAHVGGVGVAGAWYGRCGVGGGAAGLGYVDVGEDQAGYGGGDGAVGFHGGKQSLYLHRISCIIHPLIPIPHPLSISHLGPRRIPLPPSLQRRRLIHPINLGETTLAQRTSVLPIRPFLNTGKAE